VDPIRDRGFDQETGWDVKSDFGSKVKIRVREDYPRHRIQLKDRVADLALDIVGSSNLNSLILLLNTNPNYGKERPTAL
jgi:hypothetical protein